MLPGIDRLSLIRLLRRCTDAGVLVVSGKLADDVFDPVMLAGADMHLAKPFTFEQVALAAVSRDSRLAAASVLSSTERTSVSTPWARCSRARQQRGRRALQEHQAGTGLDAVFGCAEI